MPPTGRRSQRRIAWPSAGSADRSVDANARTRFRLASLSATTTHELTAEASHPRSAPIRRASRARRDIVVSRSSRLTISVLSSMTRRDRLAGWNARMSMTPRSP